MDNEGNAAGIVDQQNIASLLAAMKDMEHRSNERMDLMEHRSNERMEAAMKDMEHRSNERMDRIERNIESILTTLNLIGKRMDDIERGQQIFNERMDRMENGLNGLNERMDHMNSTLLRIDSTVSELHRDFHQKASPSCPNTVSQRGREHVIS